MKIRSLLLLVIASIMTLSSVDAHPRFGHQHTSLNKRMHHNRGKMARIRAHKMRHHMAGRPFMRKMRTPRVGVSIVF